MKILHIAGARPNFMKLAPVVRALQAMDGVSQLIVHTGQHYDKQMSDVFFEQLGIPEPDINLAVGPGSHAQQTAEIMTRFEPVLLESKPDWVVVYGDVNSTVATALVCSKLGRRVAHVEAGLRSRDRSMPEEINRLLTDQLADLLFTPSTDGDENLLREGVAREKIHFVGNVMIDTLIRMLPQAENAKPSDLPARYALVTMHRPANVDNPEWLARLFSYLSRLGEQLPVVFPLHPRTRKQLALGGVDVANTPNLRLMDPAPYLEFLALQKGATLVITDSGGIQEETTYLGVPCLTLRDNTERPITVDFGTNILVGTDLDKLPAAIEVALRQGGGRKRIPPLWDGHASERIARILVNHI